MRLVSARDQQTAQLSLVECRASTNTMLHFRPCLSMVLRVWCTQDTPIFGIGIYKKVWTGTGILRGRDIDEPIGKGGLGHCSI